ncbi:MAG: hypothetical protein V3W19_02585, partial [Desulfatiglandales bacterium]
ENIPECLLLPDYDKQYGQGAGVIGAGSWCASLDLIERKSHFQYFLCSQPALPPILPVEALGPTCHLSIVGDSVKISKSDNFLKAISSGQGGGRLLMRF